MDSASLLPRDCVNKSFASFMKTQPTEELIRYVARYLTVLIPVEELQPLPSPPPTPAKVRFTDQQYSLPHYFPPLEHWIDRIVNYRSTRVYSVPALFAVLIYVERLCHAIHNLVGKIDTRHRVFLAAFMVASKYLNDASPKNSQWQYAAVIYDSEEIETMELQLLFALKFDLHFTERDVMRHAVLFMPGDELNTETRIREARQSAVRRVNKASAVRSRGPKMPLTPPYDAPPLSMQQLAKQLEAASLGVATYAQVAAATLASSRPAPLHATNSTDSITSVASLTDDNGTSSSSSNDSSSSETEERARRFILRPVPATARRKASGQHAPPRPVLVRSASSSPASPSTEFTRGHLKYSALPTPRGVRDTKPRSVSARTARMVGTPLATSGSSSSLLVRTKESVSTRFLNKMWGASKQVPTATAPCIAPTTEVTHPGVRSTSYEVNYQPEYEYGLTHSGQV